MIKEDNPLYVIADYIYKFLVNRISLKSQIDNKKEFTDLTTNRFENSLFFIVFWSIIHLTMHLLGLFSIGAPIGESLGVALTAYLPYWAIKLVAGIVMSIQEKKIVWPNNIMLKFIPIAVFIYIAIMLFPHW